MADLDEDSDADGLATRRDNDLDALFERARSHPPSGPQLERMLRAMKALQPEGPYVIAGYSFGGAVAHEIGARLAGAGEATAVTILGIVAYYDHYWNDRWSSTIGWSMTDIDEEDGMGDEEFKKGQIASTNLLYRPTDHVLTGIEFSWGQREDVDGTDGEDFRVQYSLKVDFSLKGS